MLMVSNDCRAKLCLEYAPTGVPTIVSVVTRGTSDDCNSVALQAPEAYLRLSTTPNTVAFHYSIDGNYWHLVRYFTLGSTAQVRVGFVAQSPLGDGCEVSFRNVYYRPGELGNLRDGH